MTDMTAGPWSTVQRSATPVAPSAIQPSRKVDGQLVYAIGDIHGCYDQLRRLLADISSDAQRHAKGRTATLIFCGDYIDRGPASMQVLDALCWLKRHGPFHVHFLKGNHEQVMLTYLTDPEAAQDWMRFGGVQTLDSYGVTPPSADDGPERHLAARDDLLERMPVAHLRFLESLELMVGIGDFAFVHAGIRPEIALADQKEQDLLWIRKGFVDVEAQHERVIVHGHTWADDQPIMLPHRIGIDTGVYETGVLTAVRIEDDVIDIIATA